MKKIQAKASVVRKGINYCNEKFNHHYIGYLDADLATTLEEFIELPSWYNKDTDKAEDISTLISIFEKEGNAPETSGVNAVCDDDIAPFTAMSIIDCIRNSLSFDICAPSSMPNKM